MDKIETYKGFEIRAIEREQGRWRAEIRKADGSTLKTLVGDRGHGMSITTTADTLTAETTIDDVKKAIDAGGSALSSGSTKWHSAYSSCWAVSQV